MAFLNTLGWLAAVLLLGLIAIAFGARAIKSIGVTVPNTLERALISAGVSFAILQLAVFALLAEGWLRRGTLGILFCVMMIAAGTEWEIVPELFIAARKFLAEARQSRLGLPLVLAIAVVLILDGLMAM